MLECGNNSGKTQSGLQAFVIAQPNQKSAEHMEGSVFTGSKGALSSEVWFAYVGLFPAVPAGTGACAEIQHRLWSVTCRLAGIAAFNSGYTILNSRQLKSGGIKRTHGTHGRSRCSGLSPSCDPPVKYKRFFERNHSVWAICPKWVEGLAV